MAKFSVNDTVRFSTTFLRNTYQYDYEAASKRGIITAIDPHDYNGKRLIKVLWSDESEPKGILSSNIEKS